MNFLEMQKEVQSYVSDKSSGGLPIIKDAINSSVCKILNKSLWRFAMRQTTITTTASLADYYFPSDFDKAVSLTQREDDVQLQRIWVGDFERLMPDPTSDTGRPKFYMELMEDRVLAQPTTTAKVTVVSDSNSDLTQKATIYGVMGGVDRQEMVTLSAQNFVSSVGAFSKLYSITLDLSCAGTFAAYEATAGTSLLNLYPGDRERTFKKYKLYPTPDGSYTIYLTYQAKSVPMINDSDTCIIPSRFHSAICDMAKGDILMKQGDQKAMYYIQSADKQLAEMSMSEDLFWDYSPTLRLSDTAMPYNDNPLYVN